MNPAVSVLLPVFNGAAYIRESVESILAQTFQDFELIIIDDGSLDDSAHIIEGINDPRIRLYRQANQGLPATLNGAIGLANGEFLARQDQDDVSFPCRFEKQVSYLRSHAGWESTPTCRSESCVAVRPVVRQPLRPQFGDAEKVCRESGRPVYRGPRPATSRGLRIVVPSLEEMRGREHS